MSSGSQEILALLVVTVVIGFALYRRIKRSRKKAAGCDGCDAGATKPASSESTVHFYKRDR